MQRAEDRLRIGVEVADREVRLAAGGAMRSQDVLAQVGAGAPQAHPLADPDEQARDLGVAEHEVAAGGHALVAGVHMGTGRARGAGVGVALGRLADGDRHAERVAPRPGFGHAAVPGPAVERAPAAVLEAVEADPAARVSGARRADDGRVEGRAWHAPTVPVGRDN